MIEKIIKLLYTNRIENSSFTNSRVKVNTNTKNLHLDNLNLKGSELNIFQNETLFDRFFSYIKKMIYYLFKIKL
jgi:hypothetical protein